LRFSGVTIAEVIVMSSSGRSTALLGPAAFVIGLQAGTTVICAQEHAQSIRQELEETGGFDRIIVSSEEPLPLGQLTARAKLVVEAQIAAGQSYLDESGTDVYTDYTVTIANVIKSRAGAQAGDSITVRRRSGVVVLNGREAVVHENAFPDFQIGERYILFLTRGARESVYAVLGGNQGAYTAAADNIAPTSIALDAAAAPRSISRAEFLGEVLALLKFSEY
jgi:hypothetical protein